MAPPPVPLSASSPTAPAPSSSRAEPVPIRGTGQSSGPLPTCLMPVLPAETVVSAIPTCALPSPSPGTTPPSPTAIKEDKNLDGGVKCVPKAATTAHEGAPMKKRKTGPGYRGVANLTPEQLAKKRANGTFHMVTSLLYSPGLQRSPLVYTRMWCPDTNSH